MVDDNAHAAATQEPTPADSPAPVMAGTRAPSDLAVADPPAPEVPADSAADPALELVGWHASATAPAPAGGGDLPVWSFRSSTAAPARAPAGQDQAELPLSPPARPQLPSSRPQPLFGPVGRARSALLVPLLAVVTLGVYALVWHHRVNRELEEFDPKLHSRPVRSTMALTVPWLVGLVVTLVGAAWLLGDRFSLHLPLAGHLTHTQALLLLGGLVAVPYLTLLIPFSLVAVVMTLERLRSVEEHVGTTTDRQVRPVGTALLLAVPALGGLVLLGLEQRRLNAVWGGVSPAGRVSS